MKFSKRSNLSDRDYKSDVTDSTNGKLHSMALIDHVTLFSGDDKKSHYYAIELSFDEVQSIYDKMIAEKEKWEENKTNRAVV